MFATRNQLDAVLEAGRSDKALEATEHAEHPSSGVLAVAASVSVNGLGEVAMTALQTL
jgi:hypothetical protein